MAVFKIENERVKQLSLKEDGFGDEFALRDFFASNLEDILSVRFLAKEYQTPDGRIDTLGIDENDSPVIIEYKWKENDGVLPQGLAYLVWLRKNKKQFDLLVESKLGKSIRVSWDQPRLILIAQGFDAHTRAAIHAVQGNVELRTYILYEGNILDLKNEASPLSNKAESRAKPAKLQTGDVYDLKSHLSTLSPEMSKLMGKLRAKILALPSVEEKSGQKTGITYRTTKSFTRFEFKKKWIQLLLRDAFYPEDTQKIIKDIAALKWGYQGMVKVGPDSDVDYIFSLINASYKSTL